ncbi:SapB/AmfS family lanthipeptide [Streptomyces sp. NPDC026206]
MVLLDLQAMEPAEGEETRMAFGASDGSGLSIVLCGGDE